MATLVEFVDTCGPRNGCPTPEGVIASIERFALDKNRWLKVAGALKAEVLEWAYLSRRPLVKAQAEVAVELGCFIGYSAVRIGRFARTPLRSQGGQGLSLISVEVDPI